MLSILLSAVLTLFAQVPQPQRGQMAMPPSTMSDPIYVAAPITIEIVNMEPQTLADLVASGKIAVDGANHLTIPQGPMVAKLGPDMMRPSARGERIPANSAEQPLKLPATRPFLLAAPAKITIVTSKKVKLTVEGKRLIIREM